MELVFWQKFLLVFICVAITDMCWAIYIIKTAQKKALLASIWGSGISLLSAITVISYTNDHRFIIASVLGAFIGTYVTIKYVKTDGKEEIDTKSKIQ